MASTVPNTNVNLFVRVPAHAQINSFLGDERVVATLVEFEVGEQVAIHCPDAQQHKEH
jgi:hypothetical protein